MLRRAALFAFLPCVTGCSYLLGSLIGPPPPCHPGGELSPPSDLGVYQLKQPENPAGISADPKEVHVRPAKFNEDGWAANAIEKVKPYRAPTLTADLTKGGSVLLCSFAVGNVPNIDGLETPSGPFVSISTPDLLVWADFAGQKMGKGPAFASTRAAFAFRANLSTGDRVRFAFGDFDFFSANDGIGSIVGEYKGDLPFQVRGEVGAAWCHAIPPSMIELERTKWEGELTAAVAAFEGYSPRLEKPVAWELSNRVADTLGALEYFSGPSETREKEAANRVLAASRKQWSTYLGLLQKRQDSLPSPGAWVNLNELVDVRVAGLHCQVGEKIIPICSPALEFKFKKDATEPECEHSARFFETLGDVQVVDHRGEKTNTLMSHARINGKWATSELELWRAKKGDVAFVPLFAGGFFYRQTHVGWNIPFVIVGQTWLRVI